MKKCSYCAEEIQDEAKICRFCRIDLNTGESIDSFSETTRNPNKTHEDTAKIIAKSGGCAYPFASLIIPGLGQFLKGQIGKGVIYLGLALLLGMPTMWVLGFIVAIVSAVDASSEVCICSQCKSVVDPSASKCRACGSVFLGKTFAGSDDIQSVYENAQKGK